MRHPAEKENGRLEITRRTFLQASGVTGLALLAAHFFRLPVTGGKSRSSPPPPLNQGIVSEKWVNTSCLNCPARCGISVRLVNGNAVRIAGNPQSLVSEGEICPRAHVGLQVLYDMERITQPLRRTNPNKGRDQNPRWVPLSWEEALGELTARLNTLRASGSPEKLVIFRGLNSRSDEDLISRFALAYGTPNLFDVDGIESEAEKTGRWLSDGNYDHIAYDLGETNYVLAFGASILESERPLARNLRMWGRARREKPTRTKVVVIDPRYSVTAARADQWLPINPGTDAALALAIANVIIQENLYDSQFVSAHTSGFDAFRSAAAGYSIEQAEQITGIRASAIRQIAREFARTKPAVAWAGRGIAGWPNGTLTANAIFCLNALVGSIDIPGGILYQENPAYQPMPALNPDAVAASATGRPLVKLDRQLFPGQTPAVNRVPEAILNGQPYAVELGIGLNSNFNMSAPGAPRWDEAISKLPYYVHISPFISEMALYADIVFPATTYLEQWGYDHSPPGSGFAEARIKQPVLSPAGQARNIGDIVFAMSNRIGGSTAAAFEGIGDGAEGFVRFRTSSLASWTDFSTSGVAGSSPYRYRKYSSIFATPSKKFDFSPGALTASTSSPERYAAPAFLGDENRFPLVLITYQPLLTLENGSQNYPWSQEIFFVMHGVGWTSLVELNAASAHPLGIRDGDQVWVESQFGRLKAQARVTEWVRPGIVAMARGQGHYAPGKWQKGIGVNPNDIVGVDFDRMSGQSALFNTRVKVYRA